MNDHIMGNSDNVKEEDDARSEATITFRVTNFSIIHGSIYSEPPCIIRNLPWRILVKKNDVKIGCFLQCDGVSGSWSCYARAELRIINQKEGTLFSRRTGHLFNIIKNDWGFGVFMDLKDVLDPHSGYIKDDCVIFQVKVTADIPSVNKQHPSVNQELLHIELPVHVEQHPDEDIQVHVEQQPYVDLPVHMDQNPIVELPVHEDQQPDVDIPVNVGQQPDMNQYLTKYPANSPVCVLSHVPNPDRCPVCKLKDQGS